MSCNICFEILRFPFHLLFVLRRQGPTPRIPQPPLGHPDHQDGPSSQGLRDQLGS